MGSGRRGLGAILLLLWVVAGPIGAWAAHRHHRAAASGSVVLTVSSAGKVAIGGSVADSAGAQALETAAVRLAGGKPARVDRSKLVVGGKDPAKDVAGVAAAVGRISPRVRPLTVTIAAQTVTLAGTAPTAALHRRAVAVVKAAAGSRKVVDNLVVAGAPAGGGTSKAVQQSLDAALKGKTISFEPDSARLTKAGQRVVDGVLPAVKASRLKIRVEGYTDATGPARANLTLSKERAQAVVAYLVRKGVAKARLSAVGFGETHPVATNATAAGRARNRRIELRVVAG